MYVTSYDADQMALIEKDIKNNPNDIAIIQISKSGVTTEVDANGASMMDTHRTALRTKGKTDDDIKSHWLFITDPSVGDLRARVKKEGY